MDIDLNQIEEIINQIGQAQTLEEVDALYLKLMGKSGYIATATRSLSVISKDQVKEIAPKLTQLRQLTETATKKTIKGLLHEEDVVKDSIDISIP